MTKINENFLKLPGNYLFAEIANRVAAYSAENPDKKLIKLGIGDVTRPLVPAVIDAMHRAVEEMGSADTFRGYGPDYGYDFLLEAIRADYAKRGVRLGTDEIFVSDGAKSDCGNIVDIFGQDNIVAVCDPVYPVYIDSNAMSGRLGSCVDGRWQKLIYMPCTAENGFEPALPDTVPDMIYLCYPNNPTGTVASKELLKKWVDYANEHESVILYDSAYEAFIKDQAIPHSIFEIDGAETCALEFRSFSKTAGFTGTRCAYTVIPQKLVRSGASLNRLWARRQSTKFNGVPYIVQRGAEAVFSEEGHKQVMDTIDYYARNAKTIFDGLKNAGLQVFGAENSPYIWAKTPGGMGSWDFFDVLLKQANVVTTPGSGFGPSGEGYIRLTAFGSAESTAEAVKRVVSVL
mgnify:FL=1